MKIDRGSSLTKVAMVVAHALEEANIRAVLTGGACATIYTAGDYQSEDLDFVLESRPSQAELDEAMKTAGFRRRGDRYVHPKTRFFVEFPAGPLGIGRDLAIEPTRIPSDTRSRVRGLSATDSCRDRLAAFYHWRDQQSLDAAIGIALRNRVDMKKIEAWSVDEGAPTQFQEFEQELARARRSLRKAVSSIPHRS